MKKKDIEKPLLDKKSQGKEDISEDIENQKTKIDKEQKKERGSTKNKWGSGQDIKDYGLWYCFSYTLPIIWKGDWVVKIQVIVTFLLTLAAKFLAVVHPIILKYIIDAMSLGEEAYYLIIMYIVVRFAAEVCQLSREISFASVSASAEIYMASKVYNHVQNQSLNFHLSRETGKIIRICSKGSQSFASIEGVLY